MQPYKMPQKLILSEKVENTEELFNEKPLQADFRYDNCTTIKRGGFIVLDFGCELRGGIALCVQSVSSNVDIAKCKVVFGESVMESLSTLGEKIR